MSPCPSCGHPRQGSDVKCPECGSYYSRALQLIAEEEANEEKQTLRYHWNRIVNSGNIKNALSDELKQFWSRLSKKGVFTIYVIIAFVFALIISVL